MIEFAELSTRNGSVNVIFANRNSTVNSVSIATVCPPAIRTRLRFDFAITRGRNNDFSFLSSSKICFGTTFAHAAVFTRALRWMHGAKRIFVQVNVVPSKGVIAYRLSISCSGIIDDDSLFNLVDFAG